MSSTVKKTNKKFLLLFFPPVFEGEKRKVEILLVVQIKRERKKNIKKFPFLVGLASLRAPHTHKIGIIFRSSFLLVGEDI
jgi:hypothetical protein